MFAGGCTEMPLAAAAEWLASHIVDDATLPGAPLALPPYTLKHIAMKP